MVHLRVFVGTRSGDAPGWLGDRFGRKKVLIVSLILFGVGSVLSALASSSTAFIIARVVLGIAGIGIITMAMSALTILFSAEERPKAVGVWSIVNFLALPIGPVLGGWLLVHYWWGWVFLINVPVAMVGLFAVFILVPESRATERPGLDAIGLLTSAVGLLALNYGLIEAGQNGWGSSNALIPLIAGCVLLAAFVFWERHLSLRAGGQPLIDLALFLSPSFTWGMILTPFFVFAMTGLLFVTPQYFQGVLHVDAQTSGLRLFPLIVGMVIGAGSAARFSARIAAKVTVAVGFGLLAAALAIGSETTVVSSETFDALWTGLAGIGVGLTMSTVATLVLSAVPPERSGAASALYQAIAKTGSPFGAAILGSVINGIYLSQLEVTGLPAAVAKVVQGSVFGGLEVARRLGSASLLNSVITSFVHGMDGSLVVSAGIAGTGTLFALIFLPRREVRRDKDLQPVSGR